jgi:hypothetical protein
MLSFLQYITETENWDSQMAGDDAGNQFSVAQVYQHIKDRKIQPVPLPISQTDGVEWWNKEYSMDNPEHVKRMEAADTSYPVIAVRIGKNKHTSPDGLNRIMKLHKGGETTVPAYVLTQRQFKTAGRVKQKRTKKHK